jgi:hypothetical protein
MKQASRKDVRIIQARNQLEAGIKQRRKSGKKAAGSRHQANP